MADDALSKLPIISGIIGKAMVNNNKTQAILDQLGDFSDALGTLDKLNISLAKVEVQYEKYTLQLIYVRVTQVTSERINERTKCKPKFHQKIGTYLFIHIYSQHSGPFSCLFCIF